MSAAPFYAGAQASSVPDPSQADLPVPMSQYQGVVGDGARGANDLDTPRLPWRKLFRPDGKFVPEAELATDASQTEITDSAATPMEEIAQRKPSSMPGRSSYDARGVVKGVYPDRQRVKLKHGPIDKYEMPAMTMVFRVKDSALLQGIAEGDERGFMISMEGSSFVVTEFERPGNSESKNAGTAVKATSNSDARGTVKEIYRDREKIKLKHGPIDKLEMPGMTMVFRVQNPALLDEVKEGEEVGFTIEMQGSAFVVTGFQK